MSSEPPPADDRAPGAGRPPGSSRRRRRGRGRGGRGTSAANPPAAGGAPAAASPAPARPQPQGRQQGGRPGRGSARGGGGDRGDRGRRAQQPQRPQPSPERDIEITDEKIFQRLLDGGLDLTQEAILEAFLYFAGEGPARRVAAQLDTEGYVTYVDPSPPTRWLLEAVSRAVPTTDHISAMGERMRALARPNNGVYDGWWASEPPEEGDEPAALEPEPAEPAPA